MKLPRLLAALFAACFLSVAAFAADASPAGTWKWTVQGRQGQGFEQTLKLAYADGQLTGTLVGMGRLPDTPITEASFKGGMVKFSVTREFGGNTVTTRYEGKLAGDTIVGTSERPNLQGGGEPVKREWQAKRAPAK